MAWFVDGQACTYFGVAQPRRLIAAGWLEGTIDYSQGDASDGERVALKMAARLIEAFSPMGFLGGHDCSLCGGPRGSKNLFVPEGECLWAAPELIVHYVEHHRYRPPTEFLTALQVAVHGDLRTYVDRCQAICAEIETRPPRGRSHGGTRPPAPPFVDVVVAFREPTATLKSIKAGLRKALAQLSAGYRRDGMRDGYDESLVRLHIVVDGGIPNLDVGSVLRSALWNTASARFVRWVQVSLVSATGYREVLGGQVFERPPDYDPMKVKTGFARWWPR